MNESWIDELAGDPAALEPQPGFETQLRSRLGDEWNGVATTVPVVAATRDARRASNRLVLGAAAAAGLLVVGGLVVLVTRDDGDVIAPADTADVSVASPTSVDPDSAVIEAAPVTSGVPDSAVVVVPTEVPSTTETVPETTAAPVTVPAPAVDMLADWPVAPFEPASLDEVPRLVPELPITGSTSISRNEFEADGDEIGAAPFQQLFYRPDDSGLILIETTAGQALQLPPANLRTPFDAPPWDDSFFHLSEGAVNLTLSDESGYVFLAGQSVSEDEMAEVARSLGRRSDGSAGWDAPALPDGFVEFQEGVRRTTAARTLRWFDDDPTIGFPIAELQVGITSPDVLRIAFPIFGDPPGETIVTDVNGVVAFAVQETSTSAIVVWSPTPGVFALFGLDGDVDEALRVVRSMTDVDRVAWEAFSEPDRSTADGCNSRFC